MGQSILNMARRKANLSVSRRLLRLCLPLGLSFMLAACLQTGGSKSPQPGDYSLSAPVGKVDSQPLPGTAAAAGPDVIGTGSVKVALIVPLTQSSGPSIVGTSLRNAAELALSEAGSSDITLLVKDDHSTPDGARAAAQAAVSEGAELILGPLFAPSVREVAQVARGAGKPVIAFSTDASAAGPNVYLLSFLVESQVDRIVDLAAAKGKKSIAALIPQNDYGRVAEAEFQQEAARKGMRVMLVEHYQSGNPGPSVQKIAALGGQIDALFIPEQADAMPAVSSALVSAGIDGKKVQILGTGIWNDARVLNLPAVQGAWFAAPENGGFNSFAQRYRAKFGSDPTRVASLSYDAAQLAAALVRTQGSQRFSESVLTNRSGFGGADGVFRFRSNGENERGLAVLQINGGNVAPISPAPKSFAGSSAT